MYGDTIIASPYTITGSIGVIGAWYYNNGLKENLGISTDYVKAGKYADLGFGFSLPLIGTVLPDRDLSDEEKQKARKIILDMYEEFLAKVSSGRDLNKKRVDEIGQGRVWSGVDGVENGLVDKLGGLTDAINLAADKLKLKTGEYEIVEYPEPPLIDFGALAPRFIGTDLRNNANYFIEDLKFRLKNNGLPLPLLPIDSIELIEPY
jgi:protease-4